MGRIFLSREHGVAPALFVCQICGNDTGEMALLGHSCDKTMKDLYEATDGKYGDKDGYKEYGHNKIPNGFCPECKKKFDDGYMYVTDKETYGIFINRDALHKSLSYILKDGEKSKADEVVKNNIVLIERDVIRHILPKDVCKQIGITDNKEEE